MNSQEREKFPPLPYYSSKLANAQLFIKNNAGEEVFANIAKAKYSIRIISPFIGIKQIEKLVDRFRELVEIIKLITSYSTDDYKGTQDEALKKLILPSKKADGTMTYNYIFDTVVCRGHFLHEKLYIIDDSIAYIGSLNFTESGLYSNYETCLKIEDEDVVKLLCEYYDKLFDEIKGKWDVIELRQSIYGDI